MRHIFETCCNPIAAIRQPNSLLAPFTALATSLYLHASSAGAAQVGSHGGVGVAEHPQGNSLPMSNAMPDGGGGGVGGGGLSNVGSAGASGGAVGGSVGGGVVVGGSVGVGGTAGGSTAGGIRFRESVGALLQQFIAIGAPVFSSLSEARGKQPSNCAFVLFCGAVRILGCLAR